MRNFNLLSTAIAAILAAGAAHAVTPADVPSANRLYVSGATATDNGLTALFLRTGSGSAPPVCKLGTIDVYIDAAAGNDPTKAKNRMILCTLDHAISTNDSATTLAANQNIAFLKESNGGSDRGTAYVADALALDFRSISNLAGCVSVANGTVVGTGTTTNGTVTAGTISSFPGHQSFVLHTGCTATESVVTQTGIADVDPALFTVGLAPVNDAQISRLQTDSMYQPMFAPAVSLNLYRALQRAQNKTLDDSFENMPSLTKAQIAGLFATGGSRSWANIKSSNGTAINSTTFTNSVTVPNLVYVCRRGDESGTQASAAEYFLNERCGKNTTPFKVARGNPTANSNQQNGTAFVAPVVDNTGNVTSIGSTADEVWAGAATADLRTCLDGHNDVNHFAIGFLGTDSVYGDVGGLGGTSTTAGAQAAQWRYIAVNGMKPTLTEVANGRYDFVMENVLNMRTQTVGVNAPISGAPLVLHDYIQKSFSSLDVIASLLVTNAHGVTGGLVGSTKATPNPIPVSLSDLQSRPVSAFTKSPNGPVNNCNNAYPLGQTAFN